MTPCQIRSITATYSNQSFLGKKNKTKNPTTSIFFVPSPISPDLSILHRQRCVSDIFPQPSSTSHDAEPTCPFFCTLRFWANDSNNSQHGYVRSTVLGTLLILLCIIVFDHFINSFREHNLNPYFVNEENMAQRCLLPFQGHIARKTWSLARQPGSPPEPTAFPHIPSSLDAKSSKGLGSFSSPVGKTECEMSFNRKQFLNIHCLI